MRYNGLDDLPEKVHDLPLEAQDIYLSAYNTAWEAFEHTKGSTWGTSQEETAERAAWAAVEDRYEREEDGTWKNRTP